MFKAVLRSFRLTKRRRNLDNLKEQIEWRKSLDASRRQHNSDFWEIQTEVENDWLNSYNKALMKKYYRRETKHRESVIRISHRTQELIDERAEKASQKAAQKQSLDKENWKDILRKKELIDILNIESKKWITLDNYKERITESLIIPENLDHSSYYSHLRDLSVIAGLGKVVPAAEDFDNRDETMAKNALLVPAFSDVRSDIRKLSYSPLQPLVEDYHAAKSRLYNYPDKIKEIRTAYRTVLNAWKAKESDPNIFLARMLQQTESLISLIDSWNRYIQIAKLDDSEVRLGAVSQIFELKDRTVFDLDQSSQSDDVRVDFKSEFLDPNPETSDAIDNFLKAPNESSDAKQGSESSDSGGEVGTQDRSGSERKKKRKSESASGSVSGSDSSRESSSGSGSGSESGSESGSGSGSGSESESSSGSESESSSGSESESVSGSEGENSSGSEGKHRSKDEIKVQEKQNKLTSDSDFEDLNEFKETLKNSETKKKTSKHDEGEDFELENYAEIEVNQSKKKSLTKAPKDARSSKNPAKNADHFIANNTEGPAALLAQKLVEMIKSLYEKSKDTPKKFNPKEISDFFETREEFIEFLAENKQKFLSEDIYYDLDPQDAQDLQNFENDHNENQPANEDLLEEDLKQKAYLENSEKAFIKLIKKIDHLSENYSDFDMYQGIVKDLSEAKSRDIDQNLKEIGKIINETVQMSKEENPDIDINQKREEMRVEDFCNNPTFVVNRMKERVKRIIDKHLFAQGRENKYLVLINLEKLNKLKIIEPHMLAKVYKHHRYDPPKFN